MAWFCWLICVVALQETSQEDTQVEPQRFSPIIELVQALNQDTEEPDSSRVRYRIRAELDTEMKAIKGEWVLNYHNASPDTISDLHFHLYMNAFKNERSTFALENSESYQPLPIDEHSFGYVDVLDMKVNGLDAMSQWTFIQPDDQNPYDQTVGRLVLSEPLAPDSSVEVTCTFVTKLPRAIARTGFHNDTYFAAQWFPKLGVWETTGFRNRNEPGWNCHQFHANTEFYADYGEYEVVIAVPDDFDVGCSGRLMRVDDAAGSKTYTFSAEKVHDVAWLASSEMIRVERRFEPDQWVTDAELQAIMTTHGMTREEAALAPVDLIFFMQPEHEAQLDRHFRAVCLAMKYFGLWYGAYPYPTLTCVDPPYGQGRAIGGMEYPTLITMGSHWLQPSDARSPEGVTIHEFGHQYWYGLVGNNEFEESWLDEGFNTYSSGLIMDLVHPPRVTYARFNQVPININRWTRVEPYTDEQRTRVSLLRDNGQDAVVRNGWEYLNRSSYGRNSYGKPATMLHQLSRELGAETFARAMRIYANKYRYKHPTSSDYQEILEQVAGRDLDWFFDQFIYGHKTIDYAVRSVSSRDLSKAIGYLETDQGREFVDTSGDDTSLFLSTITIQNKGSGSYPVDIEIRFDDDHKETVSWDGSYPWIKFKYTRPAKVTEVVIDPTEKLVIDVNTLNNSWRSKYDNTTSRAWTIRSLITIQHILQTLSGVLS
ncbi:MAG: M1 family metallopeptidase [Acidobacteria bacterium]|nr:M1 family metallopeptidase [Acidobacteriota bacterium]